MTTYIAAGEISALKHEVGNDSVELGALVAEALGASAKLSEVPGRLRDNVVEQIENDAAGLI